MAEPNELDERVALRLYLILFPILLPLNLIYDGWILSKLWQWFAVPTFDVPALPLSFACGLILVVIHVAPPSYWPPKQSNMEVLGRLLGNCIFNPTVILAAGYVVHLLAGGA